MIGAAIAGQAAKSNNTSRSQSSTRKTPSKPTISSAERAENKKLQEDLNYFGFNAGTPDGVLGRKTTTAVSQLQICLNRPITGKIDSFERQFLSQSAFKAQANGAETLRLIAQMPNGYCGLLQKYLLDFTAPKRPSQQ
jgi:peptidoglycan hydrolase-like protein with peptidoglycan-binding domain